MREFITNYPLFSYIAVPVLLFLFVSLTFIVLKPRSRVRDHFARLYHLSISSIDFIGQNKKGFSKEHLKNLIIIIRKMKTYYQMLESEELYEVEGIIANILRAASVANALVIARSSEVEIADYLDDILLELNQVRNALYSFSLTREDEIGGSFSPIGSFSGQKNRDKAVAYLKSIKKPND